MVAAAIFISGQTSRLEPLATVRIDTPNPAFAKRRNLIESMSKEELGEFQKRSAERLASRPRDPLTGYAFYYARIVFTRRYGFTKEVSYEGIRGLDVCRDPEFIRLRTLATVTVPPFAKGLSYDPAGIGDALKGFDRMIARDPRDQMILAAASLMNARMKMGSREKALMYGRRAVAAKGIVPHRALFSLGYAAMVRGADFPRGSRERDALFKESRRAIATYKSSQPPPNMYDFLLDAALTGMKNLSRSR